VAEMREMKWAGKSERYFPEKQTTVAQSIWIRIVAKHLSKYAKKNILLSKDNN